jgi:hypothetical protein
MEKSFHVGNFLVVDEIMSSWKGMEDGYAVGGCPHVTKIIRKPEGVGAECKAVACGESGLLMKLDPMEGKMKMDSKPYQREFGAGTATVLRLTEKYSGSGRIVIADSAFSSVKTLVCLHNIGLYFMGAVKTASTLYPKNAFTRWKETKNPDRGDWITYHSQYQGRYGRDHMDMFALGWNDKKLKSIIFNNTTTLRCDTDSIRRRHKKVLSESGEYITSKQDISIKRPNAIEVFFRHFNAIDVHDHYRQGSLQIERTWQTKTWWHRMFGTILGIIITNSYFAYQLEHEMVSVAEVDGIVHFTSFLGYLSYQMIHNTIDEDIIQTRAEDMNEEEVIFIIISYQYLI